MSRLGGERARTALNILIAINVLVFAYRDQLPLHLKFRKTYRIDDGDYRSMLLSIFYHVDPTHLFVNAIALHRYGSGLFVNSSSRKWQSPLFVISSYVACGIAALIGVELLSRYHEYQWEQRLSSARRSSRCGHWLCDALNDAWGKDVSSFFTNSWADLATSFRFADVRLSMWYYRVVHRIGASGAVYGWMGMRLVASWLSPHHSRLGWFDCFFLISTLAHDLNESPLSLEDLRVSALLEGDGVDHAAHIMGAVFGMVWSLAMIVCEKVVSFGLGRRFWWWSRSGGGRRLGERRDDEALARQQQQQRRQNSRLLNPQRNGRRRPERAMV